MRVRAMLLSFCVITTLAGPVRGQDFAEDPTTGISVPTGHLAGEHEASALALNPAGLNFLATGSHFQLVVTGLDADFSRGAGSGVGVYFGNSIKLPLLPRVAFGLGVEQLVAPSSVDPDPGKPIRLSLAWAFPAAVKNFSLGLTWHRYIDSGGSLAG